MSDDESMERLKSASGKTSASSPAITLQKAVEMGEYDPKYLSGFAQWHGLSRHTQFEFIRQALDNRRRHLVSQWAELNNVLDFSKKPYLQQGLKNIEDQMKALDADRERLYLEYSK